MINYYISIFFSPTYPGFVQDCVIGCCCTTENDDFTVTSTKPVQGGCILPAKEQCFYPLYYQAGVAGRRRTCEGQASLFQGGRLLEKIE